MSARAREYTRVGNAAQVSLGSSGSSRAPRSYVRVASSRESYALQIEAE